MKFVKLARTAKWLWLSLNKARELPPETDLSVEGGTKKVICTDNAGVFKVEVQKLLNEGWQVIPGTVVAGTHLIAFFEKG